MERLSFVDQIMHKIGTSGLPVLNMQGAMVIDPSTSEFEINAMIIAEHIAARLRNFPILRKKLVQDPLKIGDLKLIEDPDFDVWDHISFATLPSPGDKRCLEKHLGEFSARDLNQSRALWQFEIIEGLAGGKIAVAQKLSHATMDGTAAMKIMMSIFDQQPSPPEKLDSAKAPALPASTPTKIALLNSALKENFQRYGVDTPKIIGALSKNLASAATSAVNAWLSAESSEASPDNSADRPKADTGKAKKGPTAYPTPVNKAISNKRVIAVGIYQTDTLKMLSKAFDCKLNDICLLMTSEALANYFRGIGEPLQHDYIFCIPISTRAANDTKAGNVLTLSSVSAHNTIEPLTDRLEVISRDTLAMKAKHASDKPAKKPSLLDDVGDITNMVSPLIIDLAATILNKLHPWEKINLPANGVMSNVAGPREALYFAGMPIEYQIPMIPMFHNAGLSIGATSMGNNFSFGFHGCGKLVKQENMHYLLDGLEIAYRALADEAQKRGASETTRAPTLTTASAPTTEDVKREPKRLSKAPKAKAPPAPKSANAPKAKPKAKAAAAATKVKTAVGADNNTAKKAPAKKIPVRKAPVKKAAVKKAPAKRPAKTKAAPKTPPM